MTRISFGTSGWRGIFCEDFTFDNVRVVTQAIADHLRDKGVAGRGLVIGHDSRFMGEKFARETARVLAGSGIKSFICDRDTPTPVIAFEILRRQAKPLEAVQRLLLAYGRYAGRIDLPEPDLRVAGVEVGECNALLVGELHAQLARLSERFDRPRVVARVVEEAGRRLVRELLRPDEVLEPEPGRVGPELVRGRLDEPLDQVRGLGDAERAPVGDAAGRLVGIITDGDIRRGLERKGQILELTAKQLMTQNPKTIAAESMATEAMATMERYSITCLFVLDQVSKQPRGVVHLHDLVKAGL